MQATGAHLEVLNHAHGKTIMHAMQCLHACTCLDAWQVGQGSVHWTLVCRHRCDRPALPLEASMQPTISITGVVWNGRSAPR